MKMKKSLFYRVAFIALLAFGLSACVRQKFDNPPDTSGIDPNLPVNSSIWALKSRVNTASSNVVPVMIEDDITIAGVVVADDRSGNYYKQIVIQDTSSGIAVLIGRSNLYNDFPIGRKIYIKCKGLWLGAYGRFVQLGTTPDADGRLGDIPTPSIDKYIVKGKFDLSQVKPLPMTISQLTPINTTNEKLMGRLIELDEVEFVGSDVDTSYALPPTTSSGTDRTIQDCANNTIVLRTSGYSNFRAVKTPSGNGKLLAIYSRYNSTAQLTIRDTTDVKFYGERCNSTSTLVSIRSIRDAFASGITVVPNGTKIKGIVISDKAASNINSQNIALQDATAGIIVRFSSSTGLPSLNDEVEVDVSGQTLSEYNGVLQIGNLATSRFVKTGTGTVTPRVTTIKIALDSLQVWESTLVKINSASFVATGTFSGNKSLTDGTGTITHYTFSSANFANESLPTGTISLTGILGEYTTSTSSTKQISMRNKNDYQ
jgi:hypothetical protein